MFQMGIMENNMEKTLLLNNYVDKIKRQRTLFVVLNSFLIVALIAIYYFVFANFVKTIKPDGHVVAILWLTNILVVLGLIWLIFRTAKHLKRYQSGVRRLNMLTFKVAYKKNVSEDEICRELQNVVRIFEENSNIEFL